MKVVIIGNGTAAISAAGTLLKRNSDYNLTIISQEPYPYYPKPNLIEFLAGRIKLPELFIRDQSWYQKQGIDFINRNKVVDVDFGSQKVVLEKDKTIKYDYLLLASGAIPNLPRVPGINQAKIYTLGNLSSCLSVKEQAGKTGEALIIGGGILGLEVAKALKDTATPRVTVLEHSNYLLGRQLDEQGGKILGKMFAEMGIEVIYNAKTRELKPDGNFTRVLLDDGRELIFPVVVACIGTSPELSYLDATKIKINRGVIIDRQIKTNIDRVLAAGDVAEFEGKAWGILPVAVEQGELAARSIVGEEVDYQGTIPANKLKVAGIDLFSMGMVNPPPESGYFFEYIIDDYQYKKAVFDTQGRIVGVIILGTGKGVNQFSRLIKAGVVCQNQAKELLADDFDFKSLKTAE